MVGPPRFELGTSCTPMKSDQSVTAIPARNKRLTRRKFGLHVDSGVDAGTGSFGLRKSRLLRESPRGFGISRDSRAVAQRFQFVVIVLDDNVNFYIWAVLSRGSRPLPDVNSPIRLSRPAYSVRSQSSNVGSHGTRRACNCSRSARGCHICWRNRLSDYTGRNPNKPSPLPDPAQDSASESRCRRHWPRKSSLAANPGSGQ